jgi:GNAT superfamily N-acetyltransferase/RimJ/RimL family protein N-acetyltransferase
VTISIRPYETQDARPTFDVFQRAVKITAAADYNSEQIDAWTAGIDEESWAQRRLAAETWIAEQDGAVVGFTDLDETGYIDMLFVDPAAARTGMATALLAQIREVAASRGLTELTVNASATARPFFERHGFSVQATQEVERHGVVLHNFRMSAPVAETNDANWLPREFVHPLRVEWRDGVHLRPIAASDVDIDMPAVLNNQEMLWEMYGEAWEWPPATMTAEQDIEDLQHHADEMDRHESFNYAILPADESELFGCIYIDPVTTEDRSQIEAEVSWWVTPGSPAWLRGGLGDLAAAWLREAWPFTHVHTPFNHVRFRQTL